MKIAIDNLGPIKHADIDLNKDLIILCGGNNSGKTYVAYSIYGLFKGINDSRLYMPADLRYSFFDNNDLSKESIEIDLLSIFLSQKDTIMKNLEKRYKEWLPNIFASDRDFFNSSSINIILENSILEEQIKMILIDKSFSLGGEITIFLKKSSDNSLLTILIIRETSEEITNLDAITQIIIEKISELIFDVIFNKIFIATAERTSINLFSRELSEKRNQFINAVLDSDSKLTNILGIGQKTSRYSLPIRNGLELANSMDVLQKQKSPFAYLADEIEKSILQGKIKVADTGELQFSPLKSKKSLGIHLTASGVKSLASIIFYLRHIAKVGDFFIIDEPELNLHPDNQRKVARVIAQMVNAGIKVMLSTHSDYIIRELNNLIMLDVKGNDKVVNKLIKKYGYKQDQILNPEKVGVYLFTDKVEALEVSATGFEIKSIDDEINALNESAQDIFFTLHDN